MSDFASFCDFYRRRYTPWWRWWLWSHEKEALRNFWINERGADG